MGLAALLGVVKALGVEEDQGPVWIPHEVTERDPDPLGLGLNRIAQGKGILDAKDSVEEVALSLPAITFMM